MAELPDQLHARYLAEQILARFEARSDEIANEIVACALAEVDGFRGLAGPRLHSELRILSDCHVGAF